MIKLTKMGITGRVFNWVRVFLFGRKIEVRIGADISSQYIVGNGTPQGSVISPLLFTISINDVFSNIPTDIGRALFADDGALWKRGKNIEHIVGKMQRAIDKVTVWGFDWGCKFSTEKTKIMCFTRKRKCHEVKLKMYREELERVGTLKYLGVVFDSLTWGEHVKRIEGKSKKVINVMRCIAGQAWGASCLSLKRVYTALIRSALDYGSVAYGSAARNHLKKLDVLQAQSLRVCCGAFKSTPVSALQVQTEEMPLELRRKQLIMNYWINLQGQANDHPAKQTLLNVWKESH